jgi:hypothetical protein
MQVLGVGLFPAPQIRSSAPPGLMRLLALSIVRLLAFPRRPGVLAWPAGIPAGLVGSSVGLESGARFTGLLTAAAVVSGGLVLAGGGITAGSAGLVRALAGWLLGAGLGLVAAAGRGSVDTHLIPGLPWRRPPDRW